MLTLFASSREAGLAKAPPPSSSFRSVHVVPARLRHVGDLLAAVAVAVSERRVTPANTFFMRSLVRSVSPFFGIAADSRLFLSRIDD